MKQRGFTLLEVLIAMALFSLLGLACYQLGLPGLHYDEAAEAGVTAVLPQVGAELFTHFAAAMAGGSDERAAVLWGEAKAGSVERAARWGEWGVHRCVLSFGREAPSAPPMH